MPSKSPRIKSDVINAYEDQLDFDALFNLSFRQVEALYQVLAREKEKKMGGKPYSAYSLKKARLLSLNVADLLHMFRQKSIQWEKERKKERDETRKSKDGAPQE
jgi:hypothetical protein